MRHPRPATSSVRRLVCLAVMLVLVMGAPQALAASPWRQGGFDARNAGENIREESISVDNVSDLQITWTRSLRDADSVTTAVAGRRVYAVGTGCARHCRTRLWILDARTGDTRWRGRLPYTPFSRPGPPAIVDGRIVVAAGGLNGEVAVFNAHCEGDVCPPLWTSAWYAGTDGEVPPPTPVVSRGWIYVSGGENGGLRVYPLAGCGASVCDPSWIGEVDNPLTPAVDHGEVIVAGFNPELEHRIWIEAFPAGGCGAPTCSSVWRHDTEPLGSPFGGWSDVSIREGTIFVQRSQTLEALDLETCREAACATWSGSTHVNHTGGLAVGGDTAFVANNRLSAFPVAGCGAPTCPLSWVGPDAEADHVSIANGLVYAVDFDSVSVFDEAGCGTSVCAPLAGPIEVPDGFPLLRSRPIIGQGMLLLGGDGVVALRVAP